MCFPSSWTDFSNPEGNGDLVREMFWLGPVNRLVSAVEIAQVR